MTENEFLSTIYGCIKPGLIILTKNSSSSKIIGINAKGNIDYLLRNSYKKSISNNKLFAVYGELSKGKITSAQIREIVGSSRTCNAAVIKWILTKFGLAIQSTKNVWVASWKVDSNLVFDENITLALLDRHGEILSVNNAWINFALANGGDEKLADGVGLNYFDACNSSSDLPDNDGVRAYQGIQSVINSSKVIYSQHYTCHSSKERRWYIMFACLFADKYARVSHVAINF